MEHLPFSKPFSGLSDRIAVIWRSNVTEWKYHGRLGAILSGDLSPFLSLFRFVIGIRRTNRKGVHYPYSYLLTRSSQGHHNIGMCESALSVRSSRWPSCSPSIQNDSTLSDSQTVKDIDEGGFKCGVCAAAFIQESAMIDHMGIHNPTQDTILDNGICDANSSDSTPECLGEEPFKCGICEAAFLQEGDLIDHMHMHSPTYDKILANKPV
ncbi:hypothetical protein ScPMuIL_017023 [Solemya velum]